MPTCTRRIQFCAGHRVQGHENKCRNLHGHNYVAFFDAEAEELDDLGRVVDFSVLKQRLGGWIEEHWDHGFIVGEDDRELRDLLAAAETKVYVLPMNPTAEWMADYLLYDVAPRVLDGTGVRVRRVVLWETENCYATAEVGTR
jgi:6-pyruvoyltetrahydropterin/6-carboxytetrahydropterin synthase